MMLVLSFNKFQTLHCTSISKLQLFSNFTLIQKIVPYQKDCKLVHMIFIFIKMILEVLTYTSDLFIYQQVDIVSSQILHVYTVNFLKKAYIHVHALQLYSVEFYRGGSIVVVSSFAGYKPSEVSNFSLLCLP